MSKISIRVDGWMKDGLEHLTDETELSMSEVVRRGVRMVFEEWSGEIPDWVEAESYHEQAVRENRPELRTMHFKQRTYEYTHNCLKDERGNLAKFPPHPDKLESYYFEKVRDEVREEHADHEEEFLEHIDWLSDWYRIMHPSTTFEDRREEVVQVALFHFRHGQKREARDAVDHAEKKGALPPDVAKHEVLDEARRRSSNEKWRHEWNEAMPYGFNGDNS